MAQDPTPISQYQVNKSYKGNKFATHIGRPSWGPLKAMQIHILFSVLKIRLNNITKKPLIHDLIDSIS